MTHERAKWLAAQWALGHVCTLRHGEAAEYHKKFFGLLCKQEQDSKHQWIRVKDMLPEEKVDCIVRYQHAYCDTDGYWAIGICFYDGEKFQFNPAYKVTHWMPLPQPPKGE